MSTHKEKNLYYLDELSNYEVEDEDKDVIGWEVLDKNEIKIGKVDNLLVSKSQERVVYLDVEVNTDIIATNHTPYGKSTTGGVHEFLNKDGENHLIIPIGLAHLDLGRKIVYTEQVDFNRFAETKRIERGTQFDRDYEVAILNSYNRPEIEVDYELDDKFYDNINFRKNRL